MTGRFLAAMIREYRSRAKKTLAADPKSSTIYSCLADELASRAEAYYRRSLPMPVAVRESGYDAQALQALRAEARWSGTRMDLPRKPRAPKGSAPKNIGGAHG